MSILDSILEFRKQRNWKQFHNARTMATSLVLEATEFLEHFQWTKDADLDARVAEKKQDLTDELADVYYWVLLIAHDLDIDLEKALTQKMKKNAAKYPVEKTTGKSKKYTELDTE